MSEVGPQRLHPPWPDARLQREGFALGMWIFLASEVLFFGALFFAYLVHRYQEPLALAQSARATNATLGIVNTAILLTSSCAIASAERLAEAGLGRAGKVCVTLAILLGLGFLGVKAVEYSEDFAKHLFPGPGFSGSDAGAAFWSFYWIATLVHAAHLVVGVGVLMRLLLLHGASSHMPSFRAAALYWHFVDLVWIFLFPALYLVGRP